MCVRLTKIALFGIVIAASAAVALVGCDRSDMPADAAEVAESRDKPRSDEAHKVPDDERAELLSRAQLWRRPVVAPGRAQFSDVAVDQVSCKFKVSDLGGTTPKFDCVLESGEEVRIKYGNGPEIPAETAATRLLSALGFGADHMTLVRTLRCYGCPKEPFSMMQAVDFTLAEPLYKQVVDYNEFEEFSWVALERKLDAYPIETEQLEGWSLFELDTVDERKGGAPRAHVDALRLIAVFLAHWDNKSENQRLVCLDRQWREGTPCARPFLLLQDVGATFGPAKLDREAWSKAPIWEDRAACTVSMRQLPYDGATFGRATITEAGRNFLGGVLSQLSDGQISELFTHARFAEKRGLFGPSGSVPEWTASFRARVATITDGPPCPTP